MWLIDAFESGFALETSESRLQIFRIMLGFACTLKFAQAFLHGGWSRLNDGGYEHYRLRDALGAKRAAYVAWAYKPILIVRLVSGVCILCGLFVKLSLIVAIIGLAFELTYEWRRNTMFLAILCGLLLPAGALGSGAPLFNSISDSTSSRNTWAQVLVVILVIDVYWNSAWQKIRSQQFRSGQLLAQYIHFRAQIAHQTAHREFLYPRPLMRVLGELTPTHVARWRVLGGIAIVMELVLPVLLFVPEFYWVAFGLGLAMHGAFTALLPTQILPFSIATVASYILFVP